MILKQDVMNNMVLILTSIIATILLLSQKLIQAAVQQVQMMVNNMMTPNSNIPATWNGSSGHKPTNPPSYPGYHPGAVHNQHSTSAPYSMGIGPPPPPQQNMPATNGQHMAPPHHYSGTPENPYMYPPIQPYMAPGMVPPHYPHPSQTPMATTTGGQGQQPPTTPQQNQATPSSKKNGVEDGTNNNAPNPTHQSPGTPYHMNMGNAPPYMARVGASPIASPMVTPGGPTQNTV